MRWGGVVRRGHLIFFFGVIDINIDIARVKKIWARFRRKKDLIVRGSLARVSRILCRYGH